MKPLFTIIAPSLGRLNLWEYALTSVVKQEYTNFEVIAVNSHPSEEGTKLISSFNDPRIRYITTSPQNSHLNWDVGYREATGEYILWLDDDNYLLPHALSTLARVIELHHPDIATGDHIHWYEAHHPVKNLRNQIVIPLPFFTHTLAQADAHNYIRKLYGMPIVEASIRSRFHFSETAIRREFVERILSMAGRIDFKNTSPRLLQLILLTSTTSIWYIDSPILIVIQMGDSMAYKWTQKKAKETRFAATYTLSPVSADLSCNYNIENLLRAKKIFPDALIGFEVNWDAFFKTYTLELSLLDQDWSQFIRVWKEVCIEMKERTSFPVAERYTILLSRLSIAIGIKILKECHLYQIAKKIGGKKQGSLKNSRVLDGNPYHIRNIRECASVLPRVIEEELQIPFQSFVGMRES